MPRRRAVVLQPALPQAVPGTEQGREILRRIALDREAAAPCGSPGAEGGQYHVTPGNEGSRKGGQILLPFARGDQEVQDGAIVPQGVAAVGLKGGHIADDPLHTLGLGPQPCLRLRKSGRRDVQHGDVCITGSQEVVDEPRSAGPDVEERCVKRQPRCLDELQRAPGYRLIPRDLGRSAGLVDRLPVFSPVAVRIQGVGSREHRQQPGSDQRH